MADSLYPGMDEDEMEAAPSKAPDSPEKPMEKKDEDGATALLPKSFFEGQELKPGEQYYVEIVRSYEDEVEVRYPHKVKGEDDEEESPESKIAAMGKEVGGGY